MSYYATCDSCGQFAWKTNHVCKPVYLALCDEWHGSLTAWDDATKIYATDPDFAAMEFGEQYDRDDSDYSIVGCETLRVAIKLDVDGSPVHLFEVSGEWTTSYMAEEVKEPPILGGFQITVDPSIPQGEVHLVDKGRVFSRIVGLDNG